MNQDVSASRLECDRDVPVYTTGSFITVKAVLSKAVENRAGLKFRWDGADYDGRAVPQTSSPAGSTGRLFRFRPSEPGIYYVTCALTDSAGKSIDTLTTRVVAFSPSRNARAARSQILGVTSASPRLSVPVAVREIKMMRLAGFDACRFDIFWPDIQPDKKTFNWTKMDALFAEFHRNGIAPLPILIASPPWASTGDANAADWRVYGHAPPIMEALLNFEREAVKRYCGYTHYWEIWNEPDLSTWLGTAEQYGQILGNSVAAIHQVDHQAVVMNGGISEVGYKAGFVQDFLRVSKPKPDVFAYHSHGPTLNLVTARGKVQGYLEDAGMANMPVWLNEAGMWISGDLTERAQALTLIKKMTVSSSLKDRAFFLYQLRDETWDKSDTENTYGLLRPDFSPKPSYAAVHTCISEISGKRYVNSLSLGEGVSSYLYSNEGESEIVAWTNDAGSTRTAVLKTNASTAALVDMMGRCKLLPVTNRMVAFPVTEEPRFLRLNTRPSGITTLTNPVELPLAYDYVGPGLTLPVRVTNPLGTGLRVKLTVSGTASQSRKKSIEVSLAGKESRIVSVPFSEKDLQTFGPKLRVILTAGTLPVVSSDIMIQKALPVPLVVRASLPWNTDKPVATLSTQRNLVSLYLATPIRELQFHGDDDLGARVFIRGASEAISFHVVVRDDIHSQKEPAGQLWEGDSLQVAVSCPDGSNYEWTGAATAQGAMLARDIWAPFTQSDSHGEHLTASRAGNETIYDLSLPASLPGIGDALKRGCSVNVLVNDNDGGGRKGWLEWRPGIGQTKDPSKFAHIAFTRN